jgi:hypothetical protein
MRENGNNNSSVQTNLRETYQPEQKTYTPAAVNGNYQPVVAPSPGAGQQPAPPTSGSGVPPGSGSSK